MFGPINLVKRYVMIGVVVLLVLACSFAVIQSNRLKSSQQENRDLSEKIVQYQKAVRLMEDLRKTNEQLARERDSLLREIQDADGYTTPLPDGIDLLLERMRIDRSSPGSTELRF